MDAPQRVSRRQVSADGTRRALMISAQQCFSTIGFDATSVAMLTSQAGVSKGGFYRHFTDKKAAFEAVFVQRLDAAADGLNDAIGEFESQPRGAGVGIAARAAAQFASLSITDPLHRELLRQAPEALGADRYQAVDDEHVLPALVALLAAMAERDELLPTIPLATTATLLLRILCSGNALICQAQDPKARLAEVLTALGAFFSGLIPPDLHAELPAIRQSAHK